MEVSENELWKEAVLAAKKKKFRKERLLQLLSQESLPSKCSRFLAKKELPQPQLHTTKSLFVLGQFILGYYRPEIINVLHDKAVVPLEL